MELFTRLRLGQMRSLEDAEQEPEWQRERAQISSLCPPAPAPMGPCTGQQSAEPAVKVPLSSCDVAKLPRNADSGAAMPAPMHQGCSGGRAHLVSNCRAQARMPLPSAACAAFRLTPAAALA